LAQPLNKWIEELEKEVVTIQQQMQERSIELQQKDPVMRELFNRHAEKAGALKYLTDKQPTDEPKSKKKKQPKPMIERKRKRVTKDAK